MPKTLQPGIRSHMLAICRYRDEAGRPLGPREPDNDADLVREYRAECLVRAQRPTAKDGVGSAAWWKARADREDWL